MKRWNHAPCRLSNIATAVVLTLGTGTLSEAAIIGNATLVRNPPTTPFTGPDTALGAPWQGYALGLQATAGEIIAAVDVSITGPLHQRWTFDEDSGAFVPTQNSINPSNGDSHLRAVTGAIFGAGPTEDNSFTGSPMTNTAISKYGVGTMLSGAWGIPLASQGSTANLAYIVVPSNRLNEISVRVKVADPSGNIIADLDAACGFSLIACEPQIEVSGNGVLIADGDDTPSLADGTDFGDVYALEIEEASRVFAINNPGSSRLHLQPAVITWPYSIWDDFPTFVDPGQTFAFSVRLERGLPRGTYPGSIAFGHDGGSGGTFNFNLTARVYVPEPASWSIAGLAMVGCILKARRRRG